MTDFSEIQALIDKGEKEAAIELLLSETTQATTDTDRRMISSLCADVGLFENAIELLDALKEPDHNDFIEKAVSEFRFSKKQQAIESLKTSLLLKESSRAYYILSVILAGEKKPYQVDKKTREEIFELLSKATSLEACGPITFLAMDEYIQVSSGHSDTETALRDANLKVAISRHPSNREIRVTYGALLARSDRDPKRALEILAPLTSGTEDPYALWLSYEAAKAAKDVPRALEFIEKLTPINGDSVTIHKVRGDLLLELGEIESAIQCYNKEIVTKKDGERKIIGLFSRSYANLKKGDVHQASKDAENAAQMCFDSDKCDFHATRVDVTDDWSDFYGADLCIYEVCKIFLKGSDISPIKKDSETYGQLCFLFSKYETRESGVENEEDYDGPNEWVLKAARIFNHPILSGELSDTLAEDNDFVGALDHHIKYSIWKYETAKKTGIAPRLDGTFYGLGDYEPSQKDAKAIHKLLKEYLEQHAADDFLFPLFAKVYESAWSKVLHYAKMYKEMHSVTQFLSTYYSSSSALFDLGFSASKLGHPEEAEDAYRRCLEISSDWTGALHNLSILVEKKNLKEAVELSRRAFEKAPSDKLIRERFERFKPLINFQELVDNALKCPVDYESLSLKDRLYLGAVLVACLSEDQRTIYSLEEANKRLGPGNDYEVEILYHLWREDILQFDPYDSPGAVGMDMKVNFRKARWILNVRTTNDMSHAKMLNELIEPGLVNEDSHEDAIALWKEVALEESLEYLQYKKATVDLNSEISEKTREYFSDLLEHYSTAQMYNIVWKSVKDAVMFQKERRLPNLHAANLVSSGCKQYGDKAMAEGWQLKLYRRNYDLPQTIISQLLYNRLLAIGDAGFTHRPGNYHIGAMTFATDLESDNVDLAE